MTQWVLVDGDFCMGAREKWTEREEHALAFLNLADPRK